MGAEDLRRTPSILEARNCQRMQLHGRREERKRGCTRKQKQSSARPRQLQSSDIDEIHGIHAPRDDQQPEPLGGR
jgi:hypothetical protein